MADDSKQPTPEEPRGLGEHTRGLASEYAHEQGWGLNEEQRARLPQGKQNTDGGTDYEYGARDFGDEPVDTSNATSSGTSTPEDPSLNIETVREALLKGHTS